jgi:hypothetical protein
MKALLGNPIKNALWSSKSARLAGWMDAFQNQKGFHWKSEEFFFMYLLIISNVTESRDKVITVSLIGRELGIGG